MAGNTAAGNTDDRACFAGAVRGFVELVRQVGPHSWEAPALGSWDVRGLVGHASRALSAIDAYLVRNPVGSADGDQAVDEVPEVEGPVAYYLATMGDPEDVTGRHRRDVAIAERGREAGIALGPDPTQAVAAMGLEALELVEDLPDDAALLVPVGPMTLAGYLPTRTFELTVHSLDLAVALDLATPGVLGPAIVSSCELAGRLAGQRESASDLLLLMTGRGDHSGKLSVV